MVAIDTNTPYLMFMIGLCNLCHHPGIRSPHIHICQYFVVFSNVLNCIPLVLLLYFNASRAHSLVSTK